MQHVCRDPYRLFFPVGILCLMTGILIWVPSIWSAESYPIIFHRTLVLNGFVTAFIGGFLFTAVPRFSQTEFASPWEIFTLLFLIILGVIAGAMEREKVSSVCSGITALFILVYLVRRIKKRKVDPPHTFIFLFIGLLLWVFSALAWSFWGYDQFKEVQFHGAFMAIILGVGSRLIPGILGHREIIPRGEKEKVPKLFVSSMILYLLALFLEDWAGNILSAAVVTLIALQYWKILSLPANRTALTWSLWICTWMIVLSYIIRAAWIDLTIHGSHAYFISGLVLLSLLIATRVIQSHGPEDETLENWKGLYVVTFLIITAAVTRVTAYLLPDHYLSHLGYASTILFLGTVIWSVKYLRYTLEVRT